MNAKEALLMLKLGAAIRRPKWCENTVLALDPDHSGYVFVRFSDGHTMKDTVENFLTQKWTDWEVHCPQDNK